MECKDHKSLPDSWVMNNILKEVEDEGTQRKLVTLWEEARRMERELSTLRRLINSLRPNDNLPY